MSTIPYETVFITEPELATEQIDQLIAKLKQTIQAHQGTITNEDRWGKKRLAYPIQGHREGFYTVITFNAAPTVTNALDHFFNVTDTVIRFMTVRPLIRKKILPPRKERTPGASNEPHRQAYRPASTQRTPRPDSAPRAESAPRPEAAAPRPESSPATEPRP